jgi:hypothetical protein
MMRISGFGLAAFLMLSGASAYAADDAPVIKLSLKDHKFDPAEADAPANKALVIEVANLDSTPAEFESKQLRVEKVVAAGGTITVKVRPLPPGRYRFYDDYHEATTVGYLNVK